MDDLMGACTTAVTPRSEAAEEGCRGGPYRCITSKYSFEIGKGEAAH